MAYTDPSQVREFSVRLRFNENEHDLMKAWTKYTGQQMAALCREMLLEQARLDLGLGASAIEEPQRSLFKA
jgi:hypothetical protein